MWDDVGSFKSAVNDDLTETDIRVPM